MRRAICASIMEKSVEKFLRAAAVAESADLIELRADGLKTPTPASVKKLVEEVKRKTALPTILAVRMKREGGAFSGSERERKSIILESMSSADFIDIELGAKRKIRDEIIKKAKEKHVRIILSYHNFGRTPEKDALLRIIKEELKAGADIAKVAVQANSEKDVLSLLEVASEGSKLGEVCTISMGEAGKLSRIAAPLLGSAITYGYVTRQTAPGQLSVKELKNILQLLEMRK